MGCNILYKAKTINSEKWVEGYISKHPSSIQIGEYSPWYIYSPPIDPDDIGGTYNVDINTLCEFIGYKDDNGKRIWQNDIVRFYLGNRVSYEFLIWWNSEMLCMSAVDLDGIYFNGHDYGNMKFPNFKYEDFCLMLQDPWCDFDKVEVVGNIFDNYDLIREKVKIIYGG